MAEHIDKTIEDLVRELQDVEQKRRDIKKHINFLCGMAKQPPRFADVDEMASASPSVLRGDEYYKGQLAGVVRKILESRSQAGLGPASVDELHTTMLAGGFVFETKDVDIAKRGLLISLAKNSQTFHKLPSGKFGLISWYPGVSGSTKPKRKRRKSTPTKDRNGSKVKTATPSQNGHKKDQEVKVDSEKVMNSRV